MRVTFIIPTLMRPELFRTILSIRNTCPVDYNILVDYRPDMNEYVSREIASTQIAVTDRDDIIAFIDDDAYYLPKSIEKALECFKDPQVQIIDGSVIGNILGTGQSVKFGKDHLGIGTTLFVRAEAFFKVGAFNTQGYGTKPEEGWRMDTILLYNVIREYGDNAYRFCVGLDVAHPNPFGSMWNPAIELAFYSLYEKEIEKHILSTFKDYRLEDIKQNYDELLHIRTLLTRDEINQTVRENGNRSFDENVMKALREQITIKTKN